MIRLIIQVPLDMKAAIEAAKPIHQERMVSHDGQRNRGLTNYWLTRECQRGGARRGGDVVPHAATHTRRPACERQEQEWPS